jgi:hypothetical protein
VTHRLTVSRDFFFRSDHDTEEEAARAFDRAAINKAGAAAQTNYPLREYAGEMDALRRVSVSELVATLRAKARRHGTQTSQYRGVSLLKQTGKWHGQINVGGKQLHLGFFATEELAARAYDRAAIHKASMEGGVVVTNLDISVYESEMAKLKTATRAELLALIADEKKNENGAASKAARAARTSGSHVPSGSGSGSGGDTTTTTKPAKPTAKRPSLGYAADAYGSRSGSEEDADARSARPSIETGARDVASGGSSRETTTRGESPPSEGTTRDLTREPDSSGAEEDDPTPAGSAGEKPSGDSDDAATTAVHDERSGHGRPVSKSRGGRQQEAQSKSSAGTKRPAPAPPPPFIPGKQRRTKQAPTRAPCAA